MIVPPAWMAATRCFQRFFDVDAPPPPPPPPIRELRGHLSAVKSIPGVPELQAALRRDTSTWYDFVFLFGGGGGIDWIEGGRGGEVIEW